MRKKIEIIMCLLASIIIIFVSVMFNADLLDIVISVAGIFYVYYIGQKKVVAYLFGITNVVLLGFNLFNKEIYFSAFYNILYGLPILIYGLYYWKKKTKGEEINQLSSKKRIILTLLMTLPSFFGIIVALINSDYILGVLDITTTYMGVLGLWLLARKYIEQWPVWIVCNAINFVMWTVLTFEDTVNISVAVMWFFYLVNSVYGYIVWKGK